MSETVASVPRTHSHLICAGLQYKKTKKNTPQTHMTEQKRQSMTSILNVIIQKLKWDPDGLSDEEEFEDMDEDDKAAFEKMRQVSSLLAMPVGLHTVSHDRVSGSAQSHERYHRSRRGPCDRCGTRDRIINPIVFWERSIFGRDKCRGHSLAGRRTGRIPCVPVW